MIFSRRSAFLAMDFVTCLFCLQPTLAANVELATALTEKNRDWRKLKRANELKDGQIANLEEARKKYEGKILCLLLIRLVTHILTCSDNQT